MIKSKLSIVAESVSTMAMGVALVMIWDHHIMNGHPALQWGIRAVWVLTTVTMILSKFTEEDRRRQEQNNLL